MAKRHRRPRPYRVDSQSTNANMTPLGPRRSGRTLEAPTASASVAGGLESSEGCFQSTSGHGAHAMNAMSSSVAQSLQSPNSDPDTPPQLGDQSVEGASNSPSHNRATDSPHTSFEVTQTTLEPSGRKRPRDHDSVEGPETSSKRTKTGSATPDTGLMAENSALAAAQSLVDGSLLIQDGEAIKTEVGNAGMGASSQEIASESGVGNGGKVTESDSKSKADGNITDSSESIGERTPLPPLNTSSRVDLDQTLPSPVSEITSTGGNHPEENSSSFRRDLRDEPHHRCSSPETSQEQPSDAQADRHADTDSSRDPVGRMAWEAVKGLENKEAQKLVAQEHGSRTFNVSRGLTQEFYDQRYPKASLLGDDWNDDPIETRVEGYKHVGWVIEFLMLIMGSHENDLDDTSTRWTPGPYGAKALYKKVRALVVMNCHNGRVTRPFTTKHNTDPESLRNNGTLRNYAQVIRSPQELGVDRLTGVNGTRGEIHITAPDLPGIDWDIKGSRLMDLGPTYTVPHGHPWRVVGYMKDHEELEYIRKLNNAIAVEANAQAEVAFRERVHKPDWLFNQHRSTQRQDPADTTIRAQTRVLPQPPNDHQPQPANDAVTQVAAFDNRDAAAAQAAERLALLDYGFA